jgi:RND family efflux transporter MFP subunit
VDVGTPEEGVLGKVTVERSDRVTLGQVLAELDTSVARAALEKARAISAFDGEITFQEARLAYAQRAHQRIKDLAAISAQDKDQAASEILTTQNLLKKAIEKRTEARLEQKLTQARLERCAIKSPIAGVVVDRYVSAGEYVNSQPLFRVAQMNPLRVEVIIPAKVFGRILPGMTATIVPELSAYGEKSATVTIVDKVIDSASNTFGVRLKLENTDGQMPAGLRCAVRFELDETGADLKKATAQRAQARLAR